MGWGLSDFLGGLKSRTSSVLPVLLVSQVTALSVLAFIVVARGQPSPDDQFLGYAALAGVGEAVGIAALYRGLAVGRITVVAPVAASAPVLPVLAGLVAGEVPGPVASVGVVLAAADSQTVRAAAPAGRRRCRRAVRRNSDQASPACFGSYRNLAALT